jgi:glycosyltransferase involved in cell wall biosynthesis
MPRVLMTADAVGGVWTHAVELAGRLASRGVRTTLAVLGPEPTELQRAMASHVADVRTAPFALEWMHEPWDDVARAGEWLLDLERTVSADVVHVNGLAHAALPFRAPVLMVAHSCVITWWRACRGGDAPASWDRYRAAVADGMRGASAIVAPSHAMLESFLDAHDPGGEHRDKARVIYNAVDPLRFTAARKAMFVLGAGRVWDEAKNLGALDGIASDLGWPVVIAGAQIDPDGERVTQRSAVHLGALSPRDMARWMSRAAIFALPARYEPFGLSPLEAALSGCALVLGDIPSLHEIWDDAAIYVDPDDRAGLVSVLSALASDPDGCASHAARARARASLYASPTRFVNEFLETYAALAPRAFSSREPVCA